MSLIATPQNSPIALALVQDSKLSLPTLITRAGTNTARRFVEFFLVNIRNPNTQEAYDRAIKQFLDWCSDLQANPADEVEGPKRSGKDRQDPGAD